MKLFHNPDIFTSLSDYTVGGFTTIKQDIEFEDIKLYAETRLRKAVDIYLQEEMASPSYRDLKQSTKEINARNSLYETVKTYFGYEMTEFNPDEMATEIFKSDHYQCWMNKISIRCQNFITNKKAVAGIPAHTSVIQPDWVANAKQETDDIDLEQILSILSGIYDV